MVSIVTLPLYRDFPDMTYQMECYATHLSLWRAAIYCGTLWLPLSLPAQVFSLFLIILHPIWFSLPVWLEV